MPDEQGELLAGLLKIARFHREHERFHATHAFEQTVQIRADAAALKHLAERWMSAEIDPPDGSYDAPQMRAAGCEDLNDPAALATRGILFMEGESEPAELREMKQRLRELGDGLARYSDWLDEKMDAAWEREAALFTPELAALAHPRHMVLMRTTTHGQKTGVAARLVKAAVASLTASGHEPAAVRADARGSAQLLRTAAWLLDAAGAILAEQAAELSLSDPDWSEFVEASEARLANASQAVS